MVITIHCLQFIYILITWKICSSLFQRPDMSHIILSLGLKSKIFWFKIKSKTQLWICFFWARETGYLHSSPHRYNIYKNVPEVFIRHILQPFKLEQILVTPVVLLQIIGHPFSSLLCNFLIDCSSFHEQIIHYFPASLNYFFTAFSIHHYLSFPKLMMLICTISLLSIAV